MNKSTVQTDKFDIGWIHKDAKCWVYFPNKNEGEIYSRGTIQKITPLNFNKGNSNVKGILDNGIQFQSKANLLQRCRESKSIERDLIDMDMISGAQVLDQLKRRFAQKKIHTYLWNSLIIVNPFKLLAQNYGQKMLNYYYQQIFLNQHSQLSKYQPHIYAFIFNILSNIRQSPLTQVLSISGQSGSGKTQTNKQCLKAISFCCEKQKLKSQHLIDSENLELKILQCDPILEAFGNAKTVKNDNSSRFGKLINIRIDPITLSIQQSKIKNFFLQKSRIISQAPGERNFHIFYLFLKFMSDDQKVFYKLKTRGGVYKISDFNYISQKMYFENQMLLSERQMWDQLNFSLVALDFKKQVISEIWSVIASILLLGNVNFDGSLQNQNDPCQILTPDLIVSISHLLKIPKEELQSGLIFNKKMIAGELMYLPLTAKQCEEGRDSMAKAIYQSLFHWIVEELNQKVNLHKNIGEQHHHQHLKQIKLLDIYGFQVFEKNSFQQLCVNYTNQKIHQIYLQQVFIHEKQVLKNQDLESSIPSLNFTDNFKIIQLLDSSNRSIFNLLDQSCTLNVKDTDFLSNIRKCHQNHQNFPPSNANNIRNSFIIKHTPGDIQYLVQGFREKNKDLLRQDIIHKLSSSNSSILNKIFTQKLQSMKHETTKKYLGIKIRKQVKDLMNQMSYHTNLHFVRCIKPNQEKKAFTFIERVCYNQIRYLGILDTIQMRKDSYHVRIPYKDFYSKYGILEEGSLDSLVKLSEDKFNNRECKDLTMNFITHTFTNHKLQYLFGRERIFMKMSTKNFLDISLNHTIKKITYSCTLIKACYRMSVKRKIRSHLRKNSIKLQRTIRNYLTVAKMMKKKKSVLIIEKYWIKYCNQFFIRKRRRHIIVLQKYIKSTIQTKNKNYAVHQIQLAKSILKSAPKTHDQVDKFKKFMEMKEFCKFELFDSIWDNMAKYYRKKAKNYIKTFLIRKLNSEKLYQTQKLASFRQTLKHRSVLQQYFKGFLTANKLKNHLNNIKKIQNYLRMSQYRISFLTLKQKAIIIQRNWRKYYKQKQESIQFTHNYFQKTSYIQNQKQIINRLLYRPYFSNIQEIGKPQTSEFCVQKILYNQEKVKREKINLFYYLLDFQMLCNLNSVYPQQSWITNYCTLFKDSIQKGNPLQYLDISDTQTICSTITKVYTWGQIQEQTNFRIQATPQIIPTLSNRLSKIKACNGYTVVQTQQPAQVLIIGNQRTYSQSSIKQWSTLNESFILLNGIVITVKGMSLSKLSIPEKVSYLTCGMGHVLCKTSLKKVYSWGQNKKGQLGLSHFRKSIEPKCIQFFSKNKIIVMQIGATAFGSLILDNSGKIWWFGSNGTIESESTPKQAFLPLKSEYIDNSKKYSVVRIIPKWSKSISLIGITLALHDGAFKATQAAIRKKCLQNLIGKWSQDSQLINPPYIATISGNFSQKHMYFKKTSEKKSQSTVSSYHQIKNKLYNEMKLMEYTQRQLINALRQDGKQKM